MLIKSAVTKANSIKSDLNDYAKKLMFLMILLQ